MSVKRSRAARALTVAGLVLTSLALAGCSNGGTTDHNDADVAFAREMVPHHQQALHMVTLTRGRDLGAGFERMARRIRAAQARELGTLHGWLDDWGAEPDRGGHRMNAGGDGTGTMGNANGMMGDSSAVIPGMMTGRDLARLHRASAQEFEDLWLRMMIRHHRGAIAMAEVEIDRGEYPAAIALARRVEEDQRAEIRQMRRLLG